MYGILGWQCGWRNGEKVARDAFGNVSKMLFKNMSRKVLKMCPKKVIRKNLVENMAEIVAKNIVENASEKLWSEWDARRIWIMEPPSITYLTQLETPLEGSNFCRACSRVGFVSRKKKFQTLLKLTKERKKNFPLHAAYLPWLLACFNSINVAQWSKG